jgi:hypothetical protein
MRRTHLLILGIVAGLGTLTACGQGTVSGSAAPAAGSTGSVPAAGGIGGATTVSQLGALVSANTAAKNTAHFAVQVSGLLNMTATGVVRFGSPLEMDEHSTMAGFGDMETVLSGGFAYVKLPDQLAQLMHVNTPWVKNNPNGTDSMDMMINQSLRTAQQNADPAAMLDKIKSSGTITATLKEEVDGQPTTHYTITIDLKKMLASLGSGDAMAAEVNQEINAGLTSEPLDIWVDSENLPVKFSESVSMPNPVQQGKTITVATTGTYTDWGQPVTITAPPADQVGSIPGN